MPISASSTGGSEPLGRLSCGAAEQSRVGSPRGWYPSWSSPPAPRARPGEASFPESIAICPLLKGPVVSPRQNPAARSDRIQGRRESEAGREGRPWRAGDKPETQPRALPEHRLPAPGLRPTRAREPERPEPRGAAREAGPAAGHGGARGRTPRVLVSPTYSSGHGGTKPVNLSQPLRRSQ
ncbi:unnamed protein product [Rangifer tarandus platyrhynchus]|uniref:Uncharacterized protein n=2 Tax=Rangifer tarandus platyrhynchus TaxID=3082113 RepID=A0ACB0EXU7_RANTA|nr:unnamed protein product [Rangifer tarandus platyrhynchus]CAI9705472.1 unnamed protein product [Rangifer tarandus platyrhynchus]